MSDLSYIFNDLEKLVDVENLMGVMKFIFKDVLIRENETMKNTCYKYDFLINYLKKIISVLDTLILELAQDKDIMISVKNRKLLRDSYELLTTVGISRCLIPALCISSHKRQPCKNQLLQKFNLKPEYRYMVLVFITEFFQRSYEISALKSIIISHHLRDFLAALIQLSHDPFSDYAQHPDYMTSPNKIKLFKRDQLKFKKMYDDIIENCFQPLVIKELLVIQSNKEFPIQIFVKKLLSKELSKRLTAPMGLTSLIRCLMDCHSTDTGVAWHKIDVICKILVAKHAHIDETEYFLNITSQLKELLALDSLQYLNTGIACLLNLDLKYPNNELVQNLVDYVFNILNFDEISKCELPNTIILTPQQIKQQMHFFEACNIVHKHCFCIPSKLILPNMYMLFLLRLNCTKEDTKSVISDLIIKNLQILETDELEDCVENFLFGTKQSTPSNVLIEEVEAGLLIKCSAYPVEHPINEATTNFLEIFNAVTDDKLIGKLFEFCFKLFGKSTSARKCKQNEETLTSEEHEAQVLKMDQICIQMLHLLAQTSALESVTNSLKKNPEIVIYLVESLLFGDIAKLNDECSTIALVLLNIVLPKINKSEDVQKRLDNLVPVIKNVAEFASEYIKILCEESISLIETDNPKCKMSNYETALTYAIDDLLPVRVHGIIELTKLIKNVDPETISRRHYLFCLFQEQLGDSDSYMYLAAINALAALTVYCPSESLDVLCKEFLCVTNKQIMTSEEHDKIIEMRLKIGDIIMKVIRKLAELAVVHKVVLLNTMLCACRDDDPFIRTSALSNIAEMTMVMNYRLGTIIYEILDVIWNTIETEKVLECRRAAVMVIDHLLKGFGKEILFQLKESLLPIYRTLTRLYKDTNEDSVVKLHAQLALIVLDDVVKEIFKPELPFEPIRNLN